MRILIYGAGVIGSLYAVLFAETGYDTSIYARGKRLEFLKKNGLLYKKNQNIRRAEATILGELSDNDAYDFILLTVRENQLYEALAELKNNKSNTIVTMVNSLDSYKKWEDIVGKGRILPAFPGAGGSINNDGILDAALTPMMIQPTTFAEISGNKSERTKQLSENIKACSYTISESSEYAYVAVMSSCHGGADCRCILRSRLPGKSGKRLEDYEENSKKTEKKF